MDISTRYSMFYDPVITPPASEPITVSYLKSFVRTNISDEDALIPDFISTARQQFEHLTQRPVLATTFRQYVDRFAHHRPSNPFYHHHHHYNYDFEMTWPYGYAWPTIYLMHGPTTSVNNVYYRDATTNNYVASTTHNVDLVSDPPRIWWTTYPPVSITETPVAYVEYTAGWATADVVPADIRVGIALLAAHFLGNRTAYITDNLRELPMGWANLCAKYSTGMEGSWRM